MKRSKYPQHQGIWFFFFLEKQNDNYTIVWIGKYVYGQYEFAFTLAFLLLDEDPCYAVFVFIKNNIWKKIKNPFLKKNMQPHKKGRLNSG
jgi:hypothetical protein